MGDVMVTVERFEANPSDGRPKIAQFVGKEGRLAVHRSREDGSLWLFADGPRGGARGRIAIPLSRAGELLGWLGGARWTFASGAGWMQQTRRTLCGFGTLRIGGRGATRWTMELDAAAWEEFVLCLREWATAATKPRAADAAADVDGARWRVTMSVDAGEEQFTASVLRPEGDPVDALLGAATAGEFAAAPMGDEMRSLLVRIERA